MPAQNGIGQTDRRLSWKEYYGIRIDYLVGFMHFTVMFLGIEERVDKRGEWAEVKEERPELLPGRSSKVSTKRDKEYFSSSGRA